MVFWFSGCSAWTLTALQTSQPMFVPGSNAATRWGPLDNRESSTEAIYRALTWCVAAVGQLLLACLAMQLTSAVLSADSTPWVQQEQHLGTGLPVVKLASDGCWSRMLRLGPLGPRFWAILTHISAMTCSSLTWLLILRMNLLFHEDFKELWVSFQTCQILTAWDCRSRRTPSYKLDFNFTKYITTVPFFKCDCRT